MGRQDRVVRGVAFPVKSPDQSLGGEAHIPLSQGTKGNQEREAIPGEKRSKLWCAGSHEGQEA